MWFEGSAEKEKEEKKEEEEEEKEEEKKKMMMKEGRKVGTHDMLGDVEDAVVWLLLQQLRGDVVLNREHDAVLAPKRDGSATASKTGEAVKARQEGQLLFVGLE